MIGRLQRRLSAWVGRDQQREIERPNAELVQRKAIPKCSASSICSPTQNNVRRKTEVTNCTRFTRRLDFLTIRAAVFVFLGARVVHTTSWYDAFYHAMVLLVAASPCAVVVSAPAVLLSAIARAGRHGVLFKGGVHLETLGKVEVIALDKTGTVTLGKPGVTEVWSPEGVDQARFLSLAASVEQRSEHPLGVPVVAELRTRGIALSESPPTEFQSHTGLGVHALSVTVSPETSRFRNWFRGM